MTKKQQHINYSSQVGASHVLSVRGIEMMTPFPVPTHRRLHETIKAVILTNEKPSFPVPEKRNITKQNKVRISLIW